MGKIIKNVSVYKVVDFLPGVDGLSLRHETVGTKDIKKVFLKKYKIVGTNENIIDISKTDIINIHKNDLFFDSTKLKK